MTMKRPLEDAARSPQKLVLIELYFYYILEHCVKPVHIFSRKRLCTSLTFCGISCRKCDTGMSLMTPTKQTHADAATSPQKTGTYRNIAYVTKETDHDSKPVHMFLYFQLSILTLETLKIDIVFGYHFITPRGNSHMYEKRMI